MLDVISKKIRLMHFCQKPEVVLYQ